MVFKKGHKIGGTREWAVGPRLRSWLFKQLLSKLFGVGERSVQEYFSREKKFVGGEEVSFSLTDIDDVVSYIQKNKDKI